MAQDFLRGAFDNFEEEKQNWYMEKFIALHAELEEKYNKVGEVILPLKEKENHLLAALNSNICAENALNEEISILLDKKITTQRELINLPSEKNIIIQKIQMNEIQMAANIIVHDAFAAALHEICKE